LGGVQSGGDNYFQTDLITVARKRVRVAVCSAFNEYCHRRNYSSSRRYFAPSSRPSSLYSAADWTGGNVGAQSSTVVIRGLNTDEITAMGPFQVILREGMAGALLGAILGTVATGWAYTLQGSLAVASAVGVSLFAIAILASIAGSALPFLFRSLGLDPL
jgi:Mg/Co/Ni transporter MgtE (contains CBS domain)